MMSEGLGVVLTISNVNINEQNKLNPDDALVTFCSNSVSQEKLSVGKCTTKTLI